jgi:hypothetical protein
MVVSVMMVILWIHDSENPVNTATVGAADLTAVAIAVPLLMALGGWWWKGRSDAAAGVSTAAQSAAAVDRLAEVMTDRWRLEARKRRIATPAPAVVRWRWAADALTIPRTDATVPPVRGTGPPPLPDLVEPGDLLGSGVVTRLHDEVYARLPYGRLVLVGGPGAGKTGAMILLLLAALASRASLAQKDRMRVPVPIWLTLGGWNPYAMTLHEWAVSTISRDHPFLRAREYGFSAAASLLHRGLVALFLDGLDEMPEATRAQALKRIDDEARALRVVITSRTEEYQQASQANQLGNTAIVELRPIRPTAAAAYLLRWRAGSNFQQWQTLASYLRLNPTSVIAQALDNPLSLSLVRDAYVRKDPAGLIDADKFKTVESVRVHLIEQLLVTAYPDSDHRRFATHWLAWMAHHMDTNRDLLWWHIPTWINRWQLRLAAMVCCLVFSGVCCGLMLWFWFGRSSGGQLTLGNAFVWGFGLGIAVGLAGLLSVMGVREPRAVIVRWPRARELGRILIVEFGLLISCAFGLVGLVAWSNRQGTSTISFAVASVLILLVLSVPVGWLAFAFFNLWAKPLANSPSATAAETYRADRRACMLNGLVVGFAGGITPLLLLALVDGWYLGLGLGSGVLTAGFLAGFARGQVPILWLTELVLACHGRGRVHFPHLLADALDRQLIRQAGTVYQFRHAAIQDHLAGIANTAGVGGWSSSPVARRSLGLRWSSRCGSRTSSSTSAGAFCPQRVPCGASARRRTQGLPPSVGRNFWTVADSDSVVTTSAVSARLSATTADCPDALT